jgi:hypothetical protein
VGRTAVVAMRTRPDLDVTCGTGQRRDRHPDRWGSEGIGPVRLAVAAGARVPTLFVRRGLRPGGVAPPETLTRFTWTLASQQVESPS